MPVRGASRRSSQDLLKVDRKPCTRRLGRWVVDLDHRDPSSRSRHADLCRVDQDGSHLVGSEYRGAFNVVFRVTGSNDPGHAVICLLLTGRPPSSPAVMTDDATLATFDDFKQCRRKRYRRQPSGYVNGARGRTLYRHGFPRASAVGCPMRPGWRVGGVDVVGRVIMRRPPGTDRHHAGTASHRRDPGACCAQRRPLLSDSTAARAAPRDAPPAPGRGTVTPPDRSSRRAVTC